MTLGARLSSAVRDFIHNEKGFVHTIGAYEYFLPSQEKTLTMALTLISDTSYVVLTALMSVISSIR